MARKPKHRYLFLVLLASLAAPIVFVDELVQRRSLDDELWIDMAVAGLLVGLGALLRQSWRGREQVDAEGFAVEPNSDGMTETVWAVTRGAHAAPVLKSLVRQACEIMGVEKAVIAVRDKVDPRTSLIVAGHGVPDDLIGYRFGLDEGMIGQVIMSGQPVLIADYREFSSAVAHEVTEDVYAGGAAPISWGGKVQGALSAASTDPARLFGEPELETLRRLADLGAVALEHAEIREQLERAVESSVEAMASAVDMRDSYTSRHSEEVLKLALEVGRRLELGDGELAELRFAARLHDLGKIAVPDSILQKQGPLDAAEWEVMKQHPASGARMLERVCGLEGVAKIVSAEHERWDGNGYPAGLSGEQIPLASRIIFACDAYHAMTSDRPYRRALRLWVAVSELRDGAGGQFDPNVVETLVGVLRERANTTLSLFRRSRRAQEMAAQPAG